MITEGKIRLYKVHKIVEVPDKLDTYIYVNALSWFKNNVLTLIDTNTETIQIRFYELSPYYLKDEDGCLYENIWQSCKIYPYVTDQNQIINGKVIWNHKAERHAESDGRIHPEYWTWRQKLRENPYPVRYPNSYEGKKTCLAFITDDSKVLTYIQARKMFYVNIYARLIAKTSAFIELKKLIDSGINLQIADIDVPNVKNGFEPTPDLYFKYINDPGMSFGHVWTLAAMLLDFDLDKLCL